MQNKITEIVTKINWILVKIKCGGKMKKVGNYIIFLFIILFSIFFIIGCSQGIRIFKFEAKFDPLRELPQITTKTPDEVEILTGEPPLSREYIELGYITYDEGWISPLITMGKSEKDIIELFKKEAAKRGADAVIKFNIEGETGERKAKGIAIIYKKDL